MILIILFLLRFGKSERIIISLEKSLNESLLKKIVLIDENEIYIIILFELLSLESIIMKDVEMTRKV
jgi:hypothetical protein